MSQLKVDLDLVRRYNVPGPRYTSYPPATKFHDLHWQDLAPELIANNQSSRDLSLYFHLPFCQSLCWYCGCTTVITTDQHQSASYLDYLEKEMEQMGALLNPDRNVVQVHYGGGTPTFLKPDELRRLGARIHRQFRVSPQAEASVEIDPRRLSRDHLLALRETGFNRVSLGVQDFNPEVQLAIHRIQPLEMTRRVIHWVRELGFDSINIDLIYGLPHQTPVTFEKTIEEVIRLSPDRIALFSYAHVPWIKPAQKILERSNLPDAEAKLAIFKMAVEHLTAGNLFTYIGMDHFAGPSDPLARAQAAHQLHRNFQGYTTHAGTDIYAFGISGISQTENAYWQNEKELPRYYELLNRDEATVARGYLLTPDDHIRRETIMRFMCDLSLDFSDIGTRFGIQFENYFARELELLAPLEDDGLLRLTPLGLEVTPVGRLLIRNIATHFDAYYLVDQEKRFSRTI